MGPGVRFVGAEAHEKNGFTGYIATYHFDDVSQLRLNQNPGEDAPGDGSDRDTVEEIITFSFKRGSSSELIIHMPESDFDASPPEPDEVDSAEMDEFMEVFDEIYKDMRLAMRIVVDGRITRTNAAYREGNSVTLMEIDFSQFASNMDLMRELARSQPDSIEGLKKLIDTVPGVKAELNEEVTVAFR
jgi:hypothetical protein